MENSVLHNHNVDVHHTSTSSFSSSSSSSSSTRSQRDVRYSCGSCGYDLNLSSSNRNISVIDSKYKKSIKRGIISFSNIDDTRFTQADEIHCAPHFSKKSWSLFRPKSKLLCRKCCNHIGYSYNGYNSSFILVSNGAEPSPSTEKQYSIRICALQPIFSQQYGNGISLLP